jgi:DegV family protein with EDD domain
MQRKLRQTNDAKTGVSMGCAAMYGAAMAGVLIVTDSSTCIPTPLAQTLGIMILPISVHLPDSDTALIEEADGSTWQLTGDLASEELMGANHPFVTEYLSVIETPGYESALVVTPAIEFSTMYRNAALASELASRSAIVHDTRTAAAGQALVVLAAAEAAARGASLDEVLLIAEDASRRVELVASLSSIEPIRRSGEVPDEVLDHQDLASERSLFRMRDGVIEPLGGADSAAESLTIIRDAYRQSAVDGVEASTIFHADAPELAEELRNLIGEVDFVSGFSIAMQVYTGRGVVGVAWLPLTKR